MATWNTCYVPEQTRPCPVLSSSSPKLCEIGANFYPRFANENIRLWQVSHLPKVTHRSEPGRVWGGEVSEDWDCSPGILRAGGTVHLSRVRRGCAGLGSALCQGLKDGWNFPGGGGGTGPATVVTKALRGNVLHKRRVWVIRRRKIHPKGCGLY